MFMFLLFGGSYAYDTPREFRGIAYILIYGFLAIIIGLIGIFLAIAFKGDEK